MDAHRTVISIAISEKGIAWGNQKVHIILLAAINDVDRRRFTDIYEALISLFETADGYQEIKRIKNFSAFRSFIYTKIKRKY